MLLAINIGNSNMRFVLLDGEIAIASIRLRSDRTRTSDDIAGAFAGALDAQGRGNLLRDATGVVVSSVVPILSDAIREMCSRSLPDIPPPLFITGGMEIGMEVRYDSPQSLGADRLVNAYAARETTGSGPFIVADFGTATTFRCRGCVRSIHRWGDSSWYRSGPGCACREDRTASPNRPVFLGSDSGDWSANRGCASLRHFAGGGGPV